MASERPRTSWGRTIVSRVDALSHDVAGLKTDVAGLKTNVMDLTTTSAALNPIVARMEGEMTLLRSDMKVLSGDFREFRGEVRTAFLGLRLVVTLLAATQLTTTFGFFWGAAKLAATVDQHSSRLDRIETRSGPAAAPSKTP